MAVLILEKRCKKCGGMICVNLTDFNQKASETTYANDLMKNIKKAYALNVRLV